MADSPIGVTFMPSADNQANGPQQGALESGAGSDLAQAFKILSLHLPRVLGARAISSPGLLNGAGSTGVAGGFNPSAAVFDALIRAMTGAAAPGGPASLSSLGAPGGAQPYAPSAVPSPSVVPGGTDQHQPIPDSYTGFAAPTQSPIYNPDRGSRPGGGRLV